MLRAFVHFILDVRSGIGRLAVSAAMRNEKDETFADVKLSKIRLPAGQPFAPVIPDHGWKRTISCRFIKKAVKVFACWAWKLDEFCIRWDCSRSRLLPVFSRLAKSTSRIKWQIPQDCGQDHGRDPLSPCLTHCPRFQVITTQPKPLGCAERSPRRMGLSELLK